MRNSTSGRTPKTTKTVQDESSSNNAAEKTSAKKLKQARLPFKIIAPAISPVGSKAAITAETEKDIEIKNGHNKETTDARKRKLSYDDSDGGNGHKDVEADDNVSKENLKVLAAASKKKKIAASSCSDSTSEVIVSLLDDSNDGVAETSVTVAAPKSSSLKTPKAAGIEKRKGAGTPQTSSSAQKDKSGGASKLQIKLPLSAGKKNKRRKSKLQSTGNTSINAGGQNNSFADSSDDIEEVAGKFNPQKRKKLDIEEDMQDNKETDVKKQEVQTITSDSDSEIEKDTGKCKQKELKGTSETSADTEKLKSIETSTGEDEKVESKDERKESKKKTTTSAKTEMSKANCTEKSPEENEEIQTISDFSDEEQLKDKEEDYNDDSIQSDNDNEADDETDNIAAKIANVSSDMTENSKSKHNNTIESLKDTENASSSAKNLTYKQTKLMEQRRKARDEKERKLQEEKMKKQQEKEEKEKEKKRDREEKEEQRRKEREEKEEQKRKEREEKERKRLAEVEVKNEEKRKKNEAKEEELRKKEEERKRKEQEKEEAELKKKKAAQAFTKFFVPKAPTNTLVNNEEDSNTGDGTKILAFRPFQVKGDMTLAPLCRKMFTTEAKHRLDSLLGSRHKNESRGNDVDEDEEKDIICKALSKSELYLSELRSGKIFPGKWRRPSTESKDDVIFVEDDLDRVGQAIVEDTPAYVREQMRVKFYKFHDNRRPPYYGTWRKKSSIIKATKPFEQDKKFFDYEVDSDDEWEEEEPGESLEDGSDDDKEKESEDEDYEVDNEWFVPHGHLSDEELQNEDEFGMGDDNTREAQKAKLQIIQQEFAQEMKKKTEKIKPRLIGCIWVDLNGNHPTDCAKIIWDTLEKKAMLYTEPPLIEELEVERSTDPSSPSSSNANAEKATTIKPIGLSDDMIKDLTRLIHGNNHSKNFLINEYIAYIEKTEESIKNGDLRKPLKSVIRDKIDEMAEWQVVNATASSVQEMEQVNGDPTDSTKKKKKGKRRLCWVVKQEMLDRMDLSLLELQNSWEYTLPPKFVKSDKDVKPDEPITHPTSNECSLATTTSVAEEDTKAKNTKSQITKLTKVLTAQEKAKQMENPPPSSHSTKSSNIKSVTENKANTISTSPTTKEKKRVPLLMSVARGQQISTPAKNKLISQFLQKGNKGTTSKAPSPTSRTSRAHSTTSPTVEDDDVVILD